MNNQQEIEIYFPDYNEDSRVITQLSKRKIVTFSNILARANYPKTTLAINFLYLLLTEILLEDTELPYYFISLKDVSKKLGQSVKWKALLAAANELASCNVYIVDNTNNVKGNIKWLNFVGEKTDEKYTLAISIHESLKKYLLSNMGDIKPTEFMKIYFSGVVNLRSVYAKRLYIVLRQFVNSGICFLTKEQLESIFDLEGKYERNYDFKKFVLIPATKSVNEDTELAVDLSYNRKKDQYSFKIKECVVEKSTSNENEEEIIFTSTKEPIKREKSISPSKSSNENMDNLKGWLQGHEEEIHDVELLEA